MTRLASSQYAIELIETWEDSDADRGEVWCGGMSIASTYIGRDISIATGVIAIGVSGSSSPVEDSVSAGVSSGDASLDADLWFRLSTCFGPGDDWAPVART